MFSVTRYWFSFSSVLRSVPLLILDRDRGSAGIGEIVAEVGLEQMDGLVCVPVRVGVVEIGIGRDPKQTQSGAERRSAAKAQIVGVRGEIGEVRIVDPLAVGLGLQL